MTEPPPEKYVLIRDRKTLDTQWHKAILTSVHGRRGLRWKVHNYPGKTNVAYPHRDFQPEEWKDMINAP